MHRIADTIADMMYHRRVDYAFHTIFIVAVTLFFSGLMLSSVAIWPVIWQAAQGDAALSVNCRDLVRTGAFLGGFSLLYGLAMPDSRYGFAKSLLVNYLIAICVLFTVMWLRPVTILGVDSVNAFFGLLRAVIQFFISITFGLLPVVIANALAWLIREIFTMIVPR